MLLLGGGWDAVAAQAKMGREKYLLIHAFAEQPSERHEMLAAKHLRLVGHIPMVAIVVPCRHREHGVVRGHELRALFEELHEVGRREQIVLEDHNVVKTLRLQGLEHVPEDVEVVVRQPC
eukprot:8410994-Pyramimonas_sp.AAC.1